MRLWDTKAPKEPVSSVNTGLQNTRGDTIQIQVSFGFGVAFLYPVPTHLMFKMLRTFCVFRLLTSAAARCPCLDSTDSCICTKQNSGQPRSQPVQL